MDCIGCLFTRQRLNKIGDFPYFAFGCNCLFLSIRKTSFSCMDKLYSSKGKNGRLLAATFTGVSPRPMLMGAPRNTLRVFNAGVSIVAVLVCRRPQAAKPVLRRGSSRSAFSPMGKSCHGVPADWLGTDGMYPFACYAAHQRPLSLSKNNRLCRPDKSTSTADMSFAERQIAQ